MGALLVAATALAGPGGPAPKELCRPLRGTIETRAVTEGCESPLGTCFEGVLLTDSPLRGETWFTLESTGTDAQGRLVYTGELEVTLANGQQVVFESTGWVDPVTGAFQETDLATLDGALTVTLLLEGQALPGLTGFRGSVTGTLCGQVPPDR